MTVDEFRRSKDDLFGTPDSPLTPEQRQGFSGLKYYPENTSLRLELPLDTSGSHDPVIIQTSTGSQRQYSRAGVIRFSVGGQQAELTVYSDMNGYFVPFRDATGGDDSYGAGRYLEPRELPDGKLLVDFNFAYNPYCAYNEQYSCPLPPRDNWLQVRIEAGEKKFKEE